MSNDKSAQVLTGLIQKQMVILGPNVALERARKINGLTVDDKGVVTALKGDSEKILQSVIDEYISLTGDITKTIVQSLTNTTS